MTAQRTAPALQRPGIPRFEEISPAGRIGLGLALLAMVLGLIGGRTVDTDRVDGYGILFALPPIYWVGIAVGTVASAVLWRTAVVERTRYASVVPAIWLVLVHTAPQLAHEHFRFQTVWTHLGFVRVIDETRTGDVLIDARFAWPGFFGSFVPSLAQLDDGALETIIRLWPTAVLGATAVLVAALATRAYPTVPLIGSLSAVAYIMLSWTGQDYFSPQSFGFTVYLAMLVLIESGPLRTSPAWSASVPFLAKFAAAGGDRPASRTTPVFVALIILCFGAIVSHPLAPFFICMGFVILGLYGRTVAWRLLIMVGVAYVVWFFVTSEPWWSTQLEGMISQLGDIFSNIQRSTSGRVETSSPEHLFVTQVRTFVGLATFLVVLIIGVAMATERFRHLRPAVPLAPLAGIPSMAMILQSYGGEIVFRVVLFTLPMAAILIGRALATIRVRALPLAVPVLTLAVLPWLMLARFGNESFEMTTGVDRAAILAGIERSNDDTLFVFDNGFAPYQAETVGRNSFKQMSATADESYIAEIWETADQVGEERAIIIFTPSQSQWRVHGLSDDIGYLDEVGAWLAARPDTEVLYQQDGGWAIELQR